MKTQESLPVYNRKLVNLTKHAIIIMGANGDKIVIPPSGLTARVVQKTEVLGHIYMNGHHIPLTQTTYGDAIMIPEPEPETYFIVSKIVAEAFRGKRDDLLIANGLIRGPLGEKSGCKSLGKL